jgi:hypothetical protein
MSADSHILPNWDLFTYLSDLMRTLSALMLLATVLMGCSNEPEYSDQQRACIAKLYNSYDAR